MKIKYSLLLLVSAAALFCGCGEDEEETKLYLSGSAVVKGIPAYVNKGEVYSIKAYGLYKTSKTDSLLGWRYLNPFTAEYDTLRLETDAATVKPWFDFAISKDTLGTFSLTANAWADGYYSSSGSASFTIVDASLENGSLKGHPFGPGVDSFTDPRDGVTYYTNKIGDATWMLQNLAWEGSGYPYAGAEDMNMIFGRYYSWDEAVSACPEGWKLPSDSDFAALARAAGAAGAVEREDAAGAAGSLMGDVYFNGRKMWEYWPAVPISNSTLFTALPVGFMQRTDGAVSFSEIYNYSVFWTSDSEGDSALARYIYADKNVLFVGALDKTRTAASVRCVKAD